MALDKKTCEFCGWTYHARSPRSRFCCDSCRNKYTHERRGGKYIKVCSDCGARLPKDRIANSNIKGEAFCVRCHREIVKPVKSRLGKDIDEAKKLGISYGHLKASQLPRMKKILYLKKSNGVTLIVREA